MGNCAPASHKSGGGTNTFDARRMIIQGDPVWERLRDSTLDDGHFLFAQQFQDIYTDLYGAYLIPDRVAVILLEFKRFLFIAYKNYMAYQQIRASKEDPAIRHFPHPKMLPSPIVDRMWRLLCTNTRLYQKFCNHNFGAVLDRHVADVPQLDRYEATQKAYYSHFGNFSKTLWPSFSSSAALANAYQGFVWMPASRFISFHQEFERKYNNLSEAQAQEVYGQELHRLRASLHQELIEQKPNGHAKFQFEPQVEASPEPGKLPTKPTKDRIVQRQDDDDDLYMETGLNPDDDIVFSDEDDSADKIEKEDELPPPPRREEEKVERVQEIPVARLQIEDHVEDRKQEKIVEHQEELVTRQQAEDQKEEEHEEVQSPHEKEATGIVDDIKKFFFGDEDSRKVLDARLSDNWMARRETTEMNLRRYAINAQMTNNFGAEMAMSPTLVQQVWNEYKRFMLMRSLEKEEDSFIPSYLVKLAWETHIVETANYRAFCYENFGKFIHSQHLPRGVTDVQKQAYANTLTTYKNLYGQYPPEQIWGEVEQRFDYGKLYSNKFFNIFGYMNEVLNKTDKKERAEERDRAYDDPEVQERRQSIKAMAVSSVPQRGNEYISIQPNNK